MEELEFDRNNEAFQKRRLKYEAWDAPMSRPGTTTTSAASFEVGQQVLFNASRDFSAKLAPKFVGPFVVHKGVTCHRNTDAIDAIVMALSSV